MIRRAGLGLAIAALLLSAPAAGADEVTDQIDEALRAYKAKDRSGAIIALDTAASLIRQQAAEAMTQVLPEPLPGWDAEEAESGAAGAAMLGGGTSASRRYTRMVTRTGTSEMGGPPEEYEEEEQVEITVTGNSPMLQSMSMMFSNPMFAGGGTKLMMVGGRKALYDKSENSLTAMVNNQVLVAVDGDDGVPLEDLKAYFEAVDYETLERQTQ